MISRRHSISISSAKKKEEQPNPYSMDSIDDIVRFQNDVLESLTGENKSDFMPLRENDKSTASMVSDTGRREDVLTKKLNQLKLSEENEKNCISNENNSTTCKLLECQKEKNTAVSLYEPAEDRVEDQVDPDENANRTLTVTDKGIDPVLSDSEMPKPSSSNRVAIDPSTEATGSKNPTIKVRKTGNIYRTLQLINKERESNPLYCYESDGGSAPENVFE